MKPHCIITYILAILFISGCASAYGNKKSKAPVVPPEKIMCVDNVLRTNPNFTDLTLEEKPFMKRNLLGDYSYLYRFKLQNSGGMAIISEPLIFGKPEVYFRFFTPKEKKFSDKLKASVKETISKLKESCPNFNVDERPLVVRQDLLD